MKRFILDRPCPVAIDNARDEYRSFFELSTVNALDDCARKTFTFLSKSTNTWKVFLDLGNVRFMQLQSLEASIDRNKTEKLKIHARRNARLIIL